MKRYAYLFGWHSLLGLVIEDLGSISQSGLLKETSVARSFLMNES